jgi:GTP-binding protein
MDFGTSPEVAFLGRSNVGKSSLLNAVIGTTLAHTSSKLGRTRAMNAFSIGADDSTGDDGRKLVVLDMPGYGKGGREEWGKEILKYLEKREQLKRAFVLIDCEHGLKPTDKQLLKSFREMAIPHQIILAKADKLLFANGLPQENVLNKKLRQLEAVLLDIREILSPDNEDEGSALGELIACSAEKRINGKKVGIDAVQFAILRAAGMELNEPVKAAVQDEIVPYDELVWKD